ncbi:MAG: hypothetical protein P1V36_14355 [Planctomycetota bacterium]|nr:hypothetical protein [Planctomycetota bacterium]
MKRKQFPEQQVAMALEQVRSGLKVEEVFRKPDHVLPLAQEVRPDAAERDQALEATRG